jgi:hypothetical protein
MAKLATRFLGLVVGLALPLFAWGLEVDTDVVSAVAADEAPIGIVTLPQSVTESLPLVLGYEDESSDRIGSEAGAEETTDEAATACCWLFLLGRWWCVPCG